MGGIEDYTHEASSNGTGQWNGDYPAYKSVGRVKNQFMARFADLPRTSEDPGSRLPVDSVDITIAETNTEGGTGNAHSGRDGESVLRSKDDGDSGTYLP